MDGTGVTARGLALGTGVGGVTGLAEGIPDGLIGLFVGRCVGGLLADFTGAASVYMAQSLTAHWLDP